MSVRPNAPYRDRIADNGLTLLYEGHDIARTHGAPDPKQSDQPEFTSMGGRTENGKFHQAAQQHKRYGKLPEPVRVYEKLRAGIWAYNGLFHLVDSWIESDGIRRVFTFKLIAAEDTPVQTPEGSVESERQRLIPTTVKLEVLKRDQGRCVICGSADELHFDHIIPYSKGGTSLLAENIQLLCARHNLEKSARIV
jgi:hypothetical protein